MLRGPLRVSVHSLVSSVPANRQTCAGDALRRAQRRRWESAYAIRLPQDLTRNGAGFARSSRQWDSSIPSSLMNPRSGIGSATS